MILLHFILWLKKNRTYNNYKFQDNSAKNCKNLYVGKGLTADRVYMNDQMKIHFDYFEAHQIEKFQEFVQPLYDYGCNTGNQKKFLEEFLKYMKETKDIEIFLLKKREINKTNSGERNILFNRLASEYPDDLLTFLKKYLYHNYPDKTNTKDFIQRFQIKIKKLINPSLNDVITPSALSSIPVAFVTLIPSVQLDPPVSPIPPVPPDPPNDFDDLIQDQSEQNEIFTDDSDDQFNPFDLFRSLDLFY